MRLLLNARDRTNQGLFVLLERTLSISGDFFDGRVVRINPILTWQGGGWGGGRISEHLTIGKQRQNGGTSSLGLQPQHWRPRFYQTKFICFLGGPCSPWDPSGQIFTQNCNGTMKTHQGLPLLLQVPAAPKHTAPFGLGSLAEVPDYSRFCSLMVFWKVGLLFLGEPLGG